MHKKIFVGIISVVLMALLVAPAFATNSASTPAVADALQATELIVDGSFEACVPSNAPDACPAWGESSLAFGSPICDAGWCGTGGGTAGPRTGTIWAWMGGIGGGEVATISQAVTIPAGSANLTFYWWVGAGGVAGDDLTVDVDGNTEFNVTGAALASGPQTAGYVQQAIDLSAYADGASHTVTFTAIDISGLNLNLDDISLIHTPVAAVTALNVPHITDILIHSWKQVVAYDGPAGSPATLANGAPVILPADADGSGYDTYVVTDSAVVDGRTWVAIFLGNENFVWVALDQVELAGPTP